MSPAAFVLLTAATVVQPSRRPVVTVASEGNRVVDLTIRWPGLTARSGARYTRYEWEARHYNELLATDVVSDTAASVQVLRPAPPDSLVLRIYVRGVDADGPGPWGWPSEPLVVSAASRAPPPARSDSGPPLPLDARRGGSHEPQGFRPLAGRRFDTRATGPGDGGAGPPPFPTGGAEGFDPIEHRYPTLSLIDDPAAPLSPPSVLRIAFPARTGGGMAPALLRTDSSGWSGARELYVRYALRLGDSFTVATRYELRLFTYDLGPTRGVGDMVVGIGDGGYHYQTSLRGSRPACQRARGYPARGPAGDLTPGRWYIVEVLFQPGDPGRCNGALQVWIDGRSVVDERTVGLGPSPGGPPLTFAGVRLEPIWGVTGQRVPRAFVLDVDDVYVSGR